MPVLQKTSIRFFKRFQSILVKYTSAIFFVMVNSGVTQGRQSWGGRDFFGVGGGISYYPGDILFKAEPLHEEKVIYRSMEHAVRLLFLQVLVLLKRLLVCPV